MQCAIRRRSAGARHTLARKVGQQWRWSWRCGRRSACCTGCAAQGVLALADRYDPKRLDAACRRALDVGDPAYKTVKGSLPPDSNTPPATTD